MSYRRYERTGPLPARTSMTVAERLEWAREQWRRDPTISVNGVKGMYARMMEVFGVAAKHEQLVEVRQEVRLEEKRAEKVATPVLKPADLEKLTRPEPPRLEVVKEPEPKPEPVKPPPKADEPTGRTRSRADAAIRLAFARSIATPAMAMDAVNRQIKAKYGIGLDTRILGDLFAELRGGKRRSDFGLGRTMDEPEAAPSPRRNEADQIRAAVEMLLGEVPNLAELTVRVENGQPMVTYKIATVHAGSLSLGGGKG